MIRYTLLFIICYLIGSIPFSYLIGRYWAGVDIRRTGSGNVGATNVWRAAGKRAGILAFVCDFGKGALVVLLAGCFGGPPLIALSALAVLLGHSWPVFLGFRGGKMVATGVGVVVALSPLIGAIIAVIWLLTVFIARYVSLASIITLAATPVLMLVFRMETPFILLGLFMAAFSVFKHFSNLKRLLSGTEPRIRI